MRKIIFLLTALLTGYMAAIYRVKPLMLVFVLELFLFVVSFILSRYFKRKLSLELLDSRQFVEKATPIPCRIKVNNQGKLPISRLGIKARYGYLKGEGKAKKWIWGGAVRGVFIAQIDLTAQYCGILSLKLERFKVCDYLSLFFASKKINITMETVVFPRKRELSIEMRSVGSQENNLPQNEIKGHKMDAHQDIRQLREYRTGDSNRYIHWNQSARTEQLWVKEFEKETDDCVALLLDLAGIWSASMLEKDAFYELLSAFLHGFLQRAEVILVYWPNADKNCMECAAVSDEFKVQDLIYSLYCLEKQINFVHQSKIICNPDHMAQEKYFKIGVDLALYWNQTLIYKFSKEMLSAEIARASLVI